MAFNSSKIIELKKTDNVNGAPEQETTGTLYYLPSDQQCMTTLKKHLPVSEEDKHTFTRWPSYSILSMRAYVTHKFVQDGSHSTNSSLIHGGQKLKATKSLPIGE